MASESTEQTKSTKSTSGIAGYWGGKTNCTPEFLDPVAQRLLAVSAGDLRAAVMREVASTLKKTRGHPIRAAKNGLKRLYSSGLISKNEIESLGQICDAILAIERGKQNPNVARAKIEEIYHALLADSGSSNVALAIASISAGAGGGVIDVGGDGSPNGKPTVLAITKSDQVDAGVVGGMITGAVIGGAIGGAGGAVIGGVIGGIAGGVATACAT
jgi:hypothetical protein